MWKGRNYKKTNDISINKHNPMQKNGGSLHKSVLFAYKLSFIFFTSSFIYFSLLLLYFFFFFAIKVIHIFFSPSYFLQERAVSVNFQQIQSSLSKEIGKFYTSIEAPSSFPLSLHSVLFEFSLHFLFQRVFSEILSHLWILEIIKINHFMYNSIVFIF